MGERGPKGEDVSVQYHEPYTVSQMCSVVSPNYNCSIKHMHIIEQA